MSGDKRENKWQRAKSPKPLFLQKRDLDILVSVYEFGFLTRQQIQRLFDFNCTTRANIRLRKLFDHGYLSRRFLPTTRGASQTLHFLGSEGVSLISERSGLDALAIRKRQKDFLSRKELFLTHDLLLNDVRIAFYRALASQPGLKLDRWVSSSDCLQEWSMPIAGVNRPQKMIFRPDGYVRYFQDSKVFGCFLEVDRSTMSNSRFQSKVRLYLNYARSSLYKERYGLQFFRVLVATPSKQRLSNLIRSTEQLTDKIFWFTLAEHLTAGRVFEPIWERPGKKGVFSLLEP